MMEKEEIQNAGSDSGSDSGSSVGTSLGSVDGIGADGSGGSVDGSGGSDNGSGGSDNGSGGSGTGAGIGSVNNDDSQSSNGTVNRSSDDVETRASRADRGRRAGSVRLGSADRNRTTADSGRSDGSAGTEPELDSEPVIRLGSRKQGRPRAEVKTDNTTELKLSEMKDIISMFLDTAFELPAMMLRQDFWRLNKDENKILTDAVTAYIKSMPKSKSNWLLNFIQENLPLVNLIMVGFFIVSDRVKSSVAIAQVTRAGSKFKQATEQATAPDNSGGIRTPLDNMFQ